MPEIDLLNIFALRDLYDVLLPVDLLSIYFVLIVTHNEMTNMKRHQESKI
jgi:hypothetical protein